MVLQIEVQGILATNAYLYIDDKNNHAFLIDPGAEAEKILQIIRERNLTVEKILLTHGHFDHIGAVEELQKILKIPVCMQKNGRAYVENPAWNLSAEFGADIILHGVTFLEDYSEIVSSANPEFKLQIIPVAGHTTDGAIFYSAKDNLAFVGDSIFLGSFGRTDFPGGDEDILLENLTKKILALPAQTILLSGHTPPTSVESQLPATKVASLGS